MNKRRKSIAIALACVMLVGTIATTVAIPGSDVPFGITVSAAETAKSGSCGENVTYNLDSEGTLTISGTGEMRDYEFDESPFYYNYSIKNVIIKDGVTSIASRAFSDCGLLGSITIPDSVISIGDEAFYRCDFLKSITIPDGVTSIGENAFKFCTVLATIKGYSGSAAENYAKENDIEFISLGEAKPTDDDAKTIDGETEIKDSGSCGANVTYTLDSEGTLTISGTGDMEDYNYGKSPFYYNNDIKKIIIENGVTSIGNYVFYLCESLTGITIPNSVTDIGNFAIGGCSSLTNIELPDGVTSIKSGAFDSCTSLKNVTIPNSVTSIWTGAFYDCTSLANITIPDSVTSIGEVAIGYFMNDGSSRSEKQTDFTISGYSGTKAEQYAKENGFNFISLDKMQTGKTSTDTLGETSYNPWFYIFIGVIGSLIVVGIVTAIIIIVKRNKAKSKI